MSIISALVGSVTTDITGWNSGLKDASNHLKSFKNESESTFKTLRGSLGRRSEFGETLELFKSGGVLFGLVEAGRILNDGTTKAREFFDEFREGKKTIGEVADGIAGSLPVIGQFWQAGRNIHEIIVDWATGAESIKSINDAAKDFLDQQNSQVKFAKSLNDYYQNIAINILKSKGQWTGKDAEVFSIGKQAKDEKEQLQTQIEVLQKQRDALNQKDIAPTVATVSEGPHRTYSYVANPAFVKNKQDIQALTDKINAMNDQKNTIDPSTNLLLDATMRSTEGMKKYSVGQTGYKFSGNNSPMAYQATIDPMVRLQQTGNNKLGEIVVLLKKQQPEKPKVVAIP
jgi:hypothetical protein